MWLFFEDKQWSLPSRNFAPSISTHLTPSFHPGSSYKLHTIIYFRYSLTELALDLEKEAKRNPEAQSPTLHNFFLLSGIGESVYALSVRRGKRSDWQLYLRLTRELTWNLLTYYNTFSLESRQVKAALKSRVETETNLFVQTSVTAKHTGNTQRTDRVPI